MYGFATVDSERAGPTPSAGMILHAGKTTSRLELGRLGQKITWNGAQCAHVRCMANLASGPAIGKLSQLIALIQTLGYRYTLT